MGNRAVITTLHAWRGEWQKELGVYLHWNGGRDSVEPFLKYCEMRGFGTPENDCYGWARLCQVLGNFFGGDLCVGIDTLWRLDKDNGDNGVYIIKDWEVVGRAYYHGEEQAHYDPVEMLLAIDKAQPPADRIGERVIRGVEDELPN